MSPQGSASIWIFIELTLALFATVYKRMPIGFYLVAPNKPLCLTCIQTTLHTHSDFCTSIQTAMKQLKQFALCTFKLLCLKNTLLDNSLSVTVVWLYICRTEIETCWLHLLSCMHCDCLFILYYEISDLLQWDTIVLGNLSICQKVDYSFIQLIYIFFIQVYSKATFYNHVNISQGRSFVFWQDYESVFWKICRLQIQHPAMITHAESVYVNKRSNSWFHWWKK